MNHLNTFKNRVDKLASKIKDNLVVVKQGDIGITEQDVIEYATDQVIIQLFQTIEDLQSRLDTNELSYQNLLKTLQRD